MQRPNNVYLTCATCKLFLIILELGKPTQRDEKVYLKHLKEKHGLIR